MTRLIGRFGELARHLNDFPPFRLTGRLLMAEQVLPDDFREFLKLLSETDVESLLIGGYAVAYHGYPRATADKCLSEMSECRDVTPSFVFR